ncbi:MAG TPA: diguanylate cyclase, partial [Geobacteraceae bacterium]
MHETADVYKKVIDTLYDGIYFVDEGRRITFWTSGTENLTGYAAHEAVGKECRSIFCHVDELGKKLCGELCPISQTLADGRMRETELYFHHREGHLVPASLRVAPVKDADGEVVVAVEMCSDNSPRYEVRQRLEQLSKQALYDPLTGLANRRYVDIKLLGRLEEMNRYGWPFGVLFIDVDHFKRVNDTYGHDIGDKVLVMVGKTLLNTLRPFDTLGRWGGEEF